MAKNQKQVQATPSKTDAKKINRKKRNAMERKSLPKAYKMLLSGKSPATFRSMTKTWQESRKMAFVILN